MNMLLKYVALLMFLYAYLCALRANNGPVSWLALGAAFWVGSELRCSGGDTKATGKEE